MWAVGVASYGEEVGMGERVLPWSSLVGKWSLGLPVNFPLLAKSYMDRQ